MFSETINSVLKLQKERLKRDELVKEKILSMINDKIINYTKHTFTCCVFQVPNFIIGYLPYDIELMTDFIVDKLQKDGLLIIKLNSENIYISWHINDLYKKEKKIKKDVNFLNLANKTKL